jgi:hypothetical protein
VKSKKPIRKKTGELLLFRQILIERGPFSQVSGKEIDPGPINFAHVLRKSQYPAARLDPENIIIMTAEEHNIFDNDIWKMEGDPRWDWVVIRRINLLEKYK